MQNKIKNKEIRNIALLLWLLLACMIVFFGLIGHVGILHIILRLLGYSVILSLLLGTLVLLLESWVGLEASHTEDTLDIPTATGIPNKKKRSDHQASGLEASLDIHHQENKISPSIMLDNQESIEPERAAKAIRQFLQEDEPNK